MVTLLVFVYFAQGDPCWCRSECSNWNQLYSDALC